jgi:hypothetical protein
MFNLFNYSFINILILVSSYITSNKLKPLLIFPGVGGSKLIDKNINENIWVPSFKYYFYNYQDWKHNIINNKNISTLEFGNKEALNLNSINLFHSIMKNRNAHTIPYDFRLIHEPKYLEEFYKKLESYIESFNEQVICLTHSSGGLILHYFLYNKSKEWKDKYIKHVININVPFGGLVISLKEVITSTFNNFFIDKDVLKSLGGLIINLPNKNVIKKILTVDENIIDDYLQYFKLHDLEYKYKENILMIESFSYDNDVNTTIIYVSNQKTVNNISIINNKLLLNQGYGDGVVPLESLLHPISWIKKDTTINFVDLSNNNYFRLLKKKFLFLNEHSLILSSKKLLDIIDSLN